MEKQICYTVILSDGGAVLFHTKSHLVKPNHRTITTSRYDCASVMHKLTAIYNEQNIAVVFECE